MQVHFCMVFLQKRLSIHNCSTLVLVKNNSSQVSSHTDPVALKAQEPGLQSLSFQIYHTFFFYFFFGSCKAWVFKL